MAFRGLKTLTAANIAAVLLIAMGLVNLILVIFQQEVLVRQEVLRGRSLIRALESHFREKDGASDPGNPSEKDGILEALVARSGFPCALVLNRQAQWVSLGRAPCPVNVDLKAPVRKAMKDGKESLTPFGAAWGVFWRRAQGLVLAMPLVRDAEVFGGVSLVLPLEEIYAGLRHSQKLVWVYILINTLLLTGIGTYRVSKAYFKPVRRLSRRAEAYSEDDGVPFLVRKEDDELGRLSQSLNLMLARISEDKEKLKSIITSLAAANKDLRQAQQEIIRTEKFASMGRLASGIAHEIGNPLGIVAGYLELLQRSDIENDEKEDYIRRSIREVERIHGIIRQLLDFSRSKEKGNVVFSVQEALAEIRRILEPQPLMSDIRLTLSLSAREDRILGDPDQVRQVFLNLVLNAADAIASAGDPASGTIVVSTENFSAEAETPGDRPQIRIAVTDDGPGIPEEDLDTIFDPFYTTKAPGKGTGLGLWVSYMIVDGMGGRISARSRLGEGTTVEVFLPVHEGHPAPETETGPAVGDAGTPGGEGP
jgi:signal transduction histidine kinase